MAPFLGVAGSTVAFLRPVNNSSGSAQVVGVDATTGRQLWHTPTGWFGNWPGLCPDDPRDICTAGSLGGPQQTAALRFRASDGTLAGDTALSHAGARSLGPDLYDTGNRDPETLTAVSGASVAWTRTLASIFPSPGMSSDNGWDFDRVPREGLFVGSVFGPPLRRTDSAETIDLSRAMTVGFRISDGTVAWRDAGASYVCGLLPCPSDQNAAGRSVAYHPPTTGLRVRATGTATISLPSGATRLGPGADLVLEGFALATGKTLWSYDAGAVGSLISNTPPFLGPSVVALPAPGGGMIALNLVTGTHRPVPAGALPAGAVSWCQSPVNYTTQVGWSYPNGPTQYVRIGQSALKPCLASGASAPIPKTVPGFVGTVVDGLSVWSGPSEVAAVPTSS